MRLLRIFGIDKAIGLNVIARITQAFGGLVSVVFVVRNLSRSEQGFYYTFGSLLAVNLFFELGLSTIITQFVSHESAHTSTGSGSDTNNNIYQSRLSSLLRFCVKWFFVAGLLLTVTLIVCGFVFFTVSPDDHASVDWRLPWIILSLATGLSLFFSPLLAYIEGLGKVQEVAVIRLIQQVSQLVILLTMLQSGGKLYSGGVALTVTTAVTAGWLFIKQRHRLFSIWRQQKEWRVSYRREIWPFQWKIGLSWVSGYFMYQLFNPILFLYDGPVAAGKMGITMSVLNGIFALTVSWYNTKTNLFSTLIARQNYTELDRVFASTVKQATWVCIICCGLLISGILGLNVFFPQYADRFLNLNFVLILVLTTLANEVISGLALYLRCHKKEPLLVFSLVIGIVTATGVLLFGKMYALAGVVISYGIITVFAALPWVFKIYLIKRHEWHSLPHSVDVLHA